MHPIFHHVSLLTRFKNQNKNFYTEVLGLRFVMNTVNQENHRMLHWFYGDDEGRPGSVVTFFVVPRLGQRMDAKSSLQTIGLNLPKDSLNFWEKRLQDLNISFIKKEKTLSFMDPDGVKIFLTETSLPPLEAKFATKHTNIPAEFQILNLRSTEFHVPDVSKTAEFFEKFLGWQTLDGKINLSPTEFIEILPSQSSEKTRMGRGSMDHVAFAVKDNEELDELYKRAQQQGLEIEELIDRGFFRSLYIREPGGNRVEFATVTPGFTFGKGVEALTEDFVLPPFLESQREEILKNIYPES